MAARYPLSAHASPALAWARRDHRRGLGLPHTGGRPAARPPRRRLLGARKVGYWTAFARTGDPDVKGAPLWSRFTGQGPVPGLVPDAVRPVGYAAGHHCAFWRSIA
ncbi:hypothetical protein GCM10009733_103160 [Nonomuraea maheshkhaliensis]|uniref:Uncharacterized protein n=1 Tax=Nonomuraea maheshkhaliensis TaxID=419590 RepID=A0ABN2HMJ3_9ACTN